MARRLLLTCRFVACVSVLFSLLGCQGLFGSDSTPSSSPEKQLGVVRYVGCEGLATDKVRTKCDNEECTVIRCIVPDPDEATLRKACGESGVVTTKSTTESSECAADDYTFCLPPKQTTSNRCIELCTHYPKCATAG